MPYYRSTEQTTEEEPVAETEEAEPQASTSTAEAETNTPAEVTHRYPTRYRKRQMRCQISDSEAKKQCTERLEEAMELALFLCQCC